MPRCRHAFIHFPPKMAATLVTARSTGGGDRSRGVWFGVVSSPLSASLHRGARPSLPRRACSGPDVGGSRTRPCASCDRTSASALPFSHQNAKRAPHGARGPLTVGRRSVGGEPLARGTLRGRNVTG